MDRMRILRQLLLFAGLFCALPLVADIPTDDELRAQAEQGNADAQNELGFMYYRGRGVEQSYAKAAEWWRKAAEQGHAGARVRLGDMYCKGNGVEQDYVEAVKWYQLAAYQEDASAQFKLGLMYAKGRGVGRSADKAERWFCRAAERRNENAICELEGRWNKRLAEWRDVRGAKRDFPKEEKRAERIACWKGVLQKYAFDRFQREDLNGRLDFSNNDELRILLRAYVPDSSGANGHSPALTEFFWGRVYRKNRDFFVEEENGLFRTTRRFRGELFDEASDANLGALARVLDRWFVDAVEPGDEEEAVRVRVGNIDEALLAYYIWWHPDRIQSVLEALIGTSNDRLVRSLFLETDKNGSLPLDLAYEVSDAKVSTLEEICSVFKKKGKIDRLECFPVEDAIGGENLLAYAIAKRDLALLELVLRYGFNPDFVFREDSSDVDAGETALHRAVWNQWKEGVRMLLDNGATNVARRDGTTVQRLLEIWLGSRDWKDPGEENEWLDLAIRIKNAKKGSRK